MYFAVDFPRFVKICSVGINQNSFQQTRGYTWTDKLIRYSKKNNNLIVNDDGSHRATKENTRSSATGLMHQLEEATDVTGGPTLEKLLQWKLVKREITEVKIIRERNTRAC